MATAGSVVVNLIANTGQFTKKLKLSEKAIHRLQGAVANVARMTARLGIAAAAAAVGGLAVLTKNAMKTIDATAKLSDRLGVSTEFMTAFGHAATLAGANQETFAKGIQYMLKNIGEANMGLKSYQDAFTEIGIDFEELGKVSPEEAFLKIARKLRDVESEATRVSVAMRIFGRSGSSLLNMMAGDLDGVIDKQKELGNTFTREQARMVEVANDAVSNMKLAFASLGNTIAISISDGVAYAADAISRMLKDTSYELAAFESGVHDIAASIFRMQKSVGQFMKSISMPTSGLNLLGDKLIKLSEEREAEAMRRSAAAWEKAWKLGNEAVQQFTPYVPRELGVGASFDEGVSSKIKPFSPSAREIDTSAVSVAGLAVNSEDRFDYDKQMVNQLEQINRNTRKTANQEMLN